MMKASLSSFRPSTVAHVMYSVQYGLYDLSRQGHQIRLKICECKRTSTTEWTVCTVYMSHGSVTCLGVLRLQLCHKAMITCTR